MYTRDDLEFALDALHAIKQATFDLKASDLASAALDHLSTAELFVRRTQPGGTLRSQYAAGSRSPECVEAHRDYMRPYMRARRASK